MSKLKLQADRLRNEPVTAHYNPFSAETLADPSSAYDHLHQNEPVHLYKEYAPPFYTLSRYADVSSALTDSETYSSEFGQGPRFTPPSGMLSNPPQHTFFRGLVQQAFTPKAIRALGPRIEDLAEELLDDVANKEIFDIHDDFAFPLPVVIIAELLDVPKDDLHLFKRWSDSAVEAMGAEDPAPWLEDLRAMATYLLDQIGKRRLADNDNDDLITRLVRAETDGVGLQDDEILSVVNQLLVGGNETTTSLIANAVWRLLENPMLWRRIVEDPTLIDVAIEESLRFDPPVLGLFRTTTRNIELRGMTIPENSKVMLHYAAANRDPEIFRDPHVFSLDRPPQRHLSFGLGVHFCLGAELARLETRTALTTLLGRYPDLDLIDSGERIKPFFLWGRRTLPVRRRPEANR